MILTTEESIQLLLGYWGQEGNLSLADESAEGYDCKIDADSISKYISDPDETCLRVYLKDLKDISDEDCIQVGRIAGHVEDRHDNTRLFVIMRTKKLLSGEDHFTPTSSIGSWAEILDYLRLNGYEIPYKGKSLFELGIAIKKIMTC